jgi:cysteine desulfurase family protein (TIGR01976 family)
VTLDLPFVRAQFPGLSPPSDPHPQPPVLADNAGGSVPADDVITEMSAFMREHMVQLGASYSRSVRAGAAVQRGREAIARLFGTTADQAVIGPSTTVNVQTLARALAPTLVPGDEVIVTELDHEANIGPWRRLESLGVVVKNWSIDPATANLDPEQLEALLSDRTRVVAFTHASNVVGRIHDVHALAGRIRACGALSVVDGVAYAPHRPVDFDALGVDVYLASLYKVYGPHQGLMLMRRPVLERAKGQYHYFHSENLIPGKLEPGNVSYEAVASLAGVESYFRRVADHHGCSIEGVFELIAAHEAALARRLLDYLDQRPDVRIIGPRSSDPQTRVPTIGFIVNGVRSSAVVESVDTHGVGIRFGDFYARRAIEALGLAEIDGIVRVSLVHYNTLAEVDRIIDALERAPSAR